MSTTKHAFRPGDEVEVDGLEGRFLLLARAETSRTIRYMWFEAYEGMPGHFRMINEQCRCRRSGSRCDACRGSGGSWWLQDAETGQVSETLIARSSRLTLVEAYVKPTKGPTA